MPILKPVKGNYYIDSIRRTHIESLVNLAKFSREHKWKKADFITNLYRPRCNAYHISYLRKIVGFIFEEQGEIINLVIDPMFRNIGLATCLINRLKGPLRIVVSDENLPAHLFFKKNGFIAKPFDKERYLFERNSSVN